MKQPPVERILFSQAQIAERVQELAAQISQDYAGQSLHLVGVLRGALPFLADLARALDLPAVTMDFLCVRRRPNSTPELLFDFDSSLAGRHVLIVEDLVSEGRTLKYVQKLLSLRQPASLKICSLLRRHQETELAYVGWDLQDQGFLVGYGLDLDERWRSLPYIGKVSAEACPPVER